MSQSRPTHVEERDRQAWRVVLAARVDRLRRMLDLIDEERPLPPFMISGEIDLIRAALTALDQLAGDRATADAIRERVAND